MPWNDFMETDILPEEFILEEMCFGILIITVLFLMAAFMLNRRRWSGYMKGFGDQLGDKERKGFEKRIKRSIMMNMGTTILTVVVLFGVFLITLAFVNSILGQWVWLILLLFIIVVLGIQIFMIFSLGRLNSLDEDENAYLYAFVKDVCKTFDIRVPTLKLEESPVMNAYTTSFFGRGSVIVVTKGLLDRVIAGRMTQEQLKAIVGHEMGHIVNQDATVITILNPAMMFTLAVRGFFEIIVRGIIFFMMAVGRFGTRGILSLLIAIGMILLLAIVLIYVGFYYVSFYILTMAVVVTWYLLSRQKEYAADLFGSLVAGSRTKMGTSLMELLRETALDEIQGKMAKKIIEERTGPTEEPSGEEQPKEPPKEPADQASEQPATMTDASTATEALAEQPGNQLTQEEKMEIYNSIDIYKEYSDNPELISEVSMRDAKVILEHKGLETLDEEDFFKFADFEYTSKEKWSEVMLSHPLFGKRVKDLTTISLSMAKGPSDEPEVE